MTRRLYLRSRSGNDFWTGSTISAAYADGESAYWERLPLHARAPDRIPAAGARSGMGHTKNPLTRSSCELIGVRMPIHPYEDENEVNY